MLYGEFVPEFKILENIVSYMEENGVTYQEVMVTINQELVTEINTFHNTNYIIDDLRKAAV